MKHRLAFLTTASLILATLGNVSAQGLRLTPATPGTTAGISQISTASTLADYIVAVVNSEPITNLEVRREIQRILSQLAQQRRPQPDVQQLASEVLERLISVKAQLQLAREGGLSIEDSAIDLAELNVAQQNQINVAELHRRLQLDGFSVTQFRAQLQEQLLLQRLHEREVEARVRVSDLEIDHYLDEQKNKLNPDTLSINLAQILVAVPETATPDQVEVLRKRAEQVFGRAKAGEDFATLASEFASTTDARNGAPMGLRDASRYPPLFVQATQALEEGEVADLVRSPAGFHILKVVEKAASGLSLTAVTQHHARHILLVPNARLSETEAQTTLANFKKQVVTAGADFAALAREHSQDGSASQGGDLGWASPGMFVPEFERVLNRLAPGEVSDPLVSRFGVHLIQLLERRKVSLTPAQQRESVRAVLHDKKYGEAFQTWSQEVRNRAYVELREPPQ